MHKFKVGGCAEAKISSPFLFFFSALLLSLPFVFYILSGCVKSWVKSLEMGP